MANEENLIPVKKGEVRNPNGRPKGVPNAKTRYLRFLTLIQQANNPMTGVLEDMTVAEQLDLEMIKKAQTGDINAYKEIMDRLEGKPTQVVDMNMTDSSTTEEKIKRFLDDANDGAYNVRSDKSATTTEPGDGSEVAGPTPDIS